MFRKKTEQIIMQNMKLTKINDTVLTEQEMSNIKGGETMDTYYCSYSSVGDSLMSTNSVARVLSFLGTTCSNLMVTEREKTKPKGRVHPILVNKLGPS